MSIIINTNWGIVPVSVTVENSEVSTINNWDFGDGTVKGGQVQTHNYGRPGTYTITLTSDGGTEQTTVTVAPQYDIGFTPTTLSIPLRKVDDDDYSSIGIRGLTSTYPTVWYDDGDFPLRNIYFWPVPAQAWAVELWLWEPLDQSVDLDAELNLPPGYERYLRYKLAAEIAAEFGKEVPPLVMQNLQEAENNIKRINQQTPLAHPSNHAIGASGRPVGRNVGVIDSVAFRSGGWLTR
jgi:hypothetical protein